MSERVEDAPVTVIVPDAPPPLPPEAASVLLRMIVKAVEKGTNMREDAREDDVQRSA